ncbi:ribonuclease R [Pseudoalteromonas sp. UG3-1]|uniref:ribonuclease R n=1 Tax=Pseudoalteromonas sp. UG3-1 TaxID=3080053 RepID=UPI0030147EA2
MPGREYIIKVLAGVKKHLNREQIAQALKLYSATDKEALRRRLRAMERDGQLFFDATNGYQVVDKTKLVTGVVSLHRDGYGFVKYHSDQKDLFLPQNQLKHVFHGDVVQVLKSPIAAKKSCHKLVKVMEHKTTHIVGVLKQRGGEAYLAADDSRIHHRLTVDKRSFTAATLGQYVHCKITHYPNHRRSGLVEVEKVIGKANSSGLATKLALLRHGANHTWTNELLAHAQNLGNEVAEHDKAGRIDYRDTPFVTIDGEDAKDFDDAVYCERNELGGWRLLVAIADVSHYVKPEDMLDVEAQTRATSIYCPGLVTPMLPESLSNGLCSLNPHQDRLAIVCDMTISEDGEITQSFFTEGVIQSHARLTYGQANQVLTKRQTRAKSAEKMRPQIKNLHALYRVLKKARKQRGAIEFETIERKLELNKHGSITAIKPVVRNDAHRMIEEFMLAANISTASFLAQQKIPAMFRVHSGPQSKKLASLKTLLSDKGLTLKGAEQPTPQDYNTLLQQVQHRSDKEVLNMLLLRSQSQAEYSLENKGHFGLAYQAYAHFTSPIRRYPDLLTHRAIRAKIQNNSNGMIAKVLSFLTADKLKVNAFNKKAYPYSKEQLEKLSTHCSLQSRKAEEISREVEAALKCQYMKPFVGQTFSATVSGVTSFGFFVELAETGVEGLVAIESLNNGAYEFDAQRQQLHSHDSSIKLGQQVSVTLQRVNEKERKLAFTLNER